MYKKRGQATILILLGIVVFGLVVGTYFAKDYVLKSKLERMSEKALVVPRQAEDVKNYVMSCISQVSREAVDMIGQQGGYFKIPGDPISYGAYNKFSNSLEILPGLRVPYWYYKQANNVDKLQILSLEQIGKNIHNYIDENLRICVGDFSGFKREGYKINPGLIKTESEIQDEKILFEVKFPVHMEIKDFEFDFDKFYYKVEKPLGELYDIARGIFNYENGKNFLEEKTIDMMVGYEEIPLTGEVFECGFIPIWDKNVVMSEFKKILSFNIPIIKILGTEHGLSEEEKKYFEVDVGSVSDDVDVNFVYSSNWPFSLDVEPEENGILKSNSISSGLGGKLQNVMQSILCYVNWHFVYNVKYPVLIMLNKDGYTFQYATMVVINKNVPRENTVKPIFFPEPDTKFCDNPQYNLDVSIYDENGEPLSDVDVSYKCINHVCDLGKSVGNYFSGKVMTCGGGSVTTSKDGYHHGETQVDTFNDVSVSVVMEEYKELDVGVQVLRGGSGEVRDDEVVYITLTNDEKDYSASLIYPNNKKVKLISGDYSVDMFMMKSSDDKIKIPGREVEHCVDVPAGDITGVFGATKEKCITTKVPSIELDRVIVGAAEFDMSISKNDLLKNKILFYVPYDGIPRVYDDLLKLSAEVGEGFVYPKFS